MKLKRLPVICNIEIDIALAKSWYNITEEELQILNENLIELRKNVEKQVEDFVDTELKSLASLQELIKENMEEIK